MHLPTKNGEWREVAKGDRLVCQRTHEDSTRYHAIITSRHLASIAKGKLLLDENSTVGVGRVFSLPENEVLGFIGHPELQRFWKGDLLWIKKEDWDGKIKGTSTPFAVVVDVTAQSVSVRRFDK